MMPSLYSPIVRRSWRRVINKSKPFLNLSLVLLSPLACGFDLFSPVKEIPSWSYELQITASHNTASFTQGLVEDGDALIESSGLYGQSFITRYDKTTSSKQVRRDIAPALFAEGIARLGRTLYLLSWRSQTGLKLDADTLEITGDFEYQGEGWGLTNVHEHLLMSNGSDYLSWREADTFKEFDRLWVHHQGSGVQALNDLSYGQGLIWANVWKKDDILAIDPHSGAVVAKLNLRRLSQRHKLRHPENVLNGLAWDEEHQGLWITGKRWPKRYLLTIEIPEKYTSEQAATHTN